MLPRFLVAASPVGATTYRCGGLQRNGSYYIVAAFATEYRPAMGRPPIGTVAMSSTERSRRRRARLGADRPAMNQRGAERDEYITKLERALAQAKGRIRELEAELARGHGHKAGKAKRAAAKGRREVASPAR